MVRWLYLDLNSFFASCEQQENPDLRGKPVAVIPMMANTTSVLAASYEAKAFGIKTGTLVGDARRMCPGIRFVKSRHQTYIKYHHLVKEVVESCVPIHSVCSVDEFACELTGTQQGLEVAIALAEKIRAKIHDQVGVAVTCSIGLGPNVILSKMATDMMKPNGLVTLEMEDLPQKLMPLKLRDVPGIGAKMEYRLHHKGIKTMEQLLRLNEREMYNLWGSVVGSRYYHLLRGENLLIPRQKNQSIGHQHVLPPDTRTFEGSLGIAQKLLSKAAIRMRKENFLTRHLGISVKFLGQQESFERSIKLQETQDTSLLMTQLNRVYQEMPRKSKPLRVSIVLSDFRKAEEHQFSFFENTKKEQLFNIVDKLNEKFGRDTVYVGSLHDKLEAAPTFIAFSRIPELEE